MALRFDARAAHGERAGPGPVGRGRLMIFGRPTLMWEGAPSPEEYYKRRGYSDVHTMDVSDYEGATFVHDLNAMDTPPALKGQYDAVSMGGTAEHVFFVGNALRRAADLLAVGGTVTCSAPANNWLDHGFYQLCPTLKFDFFHINQFDLGMSVATLYRPQESHFRRVVPVYPKEVHRLNYVPCRISHTLFATKTPASTSDVIPLQTVYREKLLGETLRWRFKPFAPYDQDEGRVMPAPLRWFDLDRPTPRNGCWAFRLNQTIFPPSLPKRPFRSKALVYEDGRLMNWTVSEVAMVPERPGSFIHSGASVFLSTTDGSDPTTNGRRYQVAFPQPYQGLVPYPDDPAFERRSDAAASAVLVED